MTTDKSSEKDHRLFRKSFSADEPDELYDDTNYDKMKVECICPKCGKKHIMNFHWIGRGTPRKFCLPCKSSHE